MRAKTRHPAKGGKSLQPIHLIPIGRLHKRGIVLLNIDEEKNGIRFSGHRRRYSWRSNGIAYCWSRRGTTSLREGSQPTFRILFLRRH
jgi:hypothetical protein